MNLTVEEILKLMEKAKELGLSYFKFGKLEFRTGFELVSYQQPEEEPYKIPPAQATFKVQAVPEKVAEELVKPLSTLDQMTDQEILYYATPYYDELQAQKEAHAKKLAEENING